ncbi:MAG: molecular chaperone DnaJ [Armatimonadetes bacterium]|nr:molecular chaperone DnaJ [Armatimonadota bacterium]
MPEGPDYYEVLGVARDADADTIRKAFRRLARQHHPDVNPEDPQAAERFKRVGEAYAVLGDPQKRAQYDRYGHVGDGGFSPGDVDFDVFGDLSQVFQAFFGGGGGGARRRRNGPRPGDDLGYEIVLTLEEVVTGLEREVSYNRLTACPECYGTGAAAGSSPQRCATCAGHGEVRQNRRTMFGYTTVVTACPDCGGAGEQIKEPCRRCRGRGQVPEDVTRSVRVPAGVEDGMRLRVTGGGNSGAQGGPDGDLWLLMRVRPHEVFQREGTDVACEVAVSFTQAALGATLTVPGLLQPQRLTIPAGTQTGTVFRLGGRGIPSTRNPNIRGDEFVAVRVVTPTVVTPEERALLRRLAELQHEAVDDGDAPPPAQPVGSEDDEDSGIFGKLRSWLKF